MAGTCIGLQRATHARLEMESETELYADDSRAFFSGSSFFGFGYIYIYM